MRFARVLTAGKPNDQPIADWIKWRKADAVIVDGDGKVIFEQRGVEVPEGWSQNAANILAQKYLRRAGVPQSTTYVLRKEDAGMPDWLRPSLPDNYFASTTGGETSARQVFHRLAGCWAYWGWRTGLFKESPNDEAQSESNARAFYDEVYACLALQYAAPASPQFFNTGLHWAYGIEGPDVGSWAVDLATGEPYQPGNAYERPQVHACFLSSVSDDLVNPGGIVDLALREARIFKGGSGSGVNPSAIRGRGEPTSGGGQASGLMSFLRIHDSAAGAIQSGGTTRRAAKMVCVDVDHPEVEAFVDWKVREEAKAAAMYVGSRVIALGGHLNPENLDLVPQAVIDRLQNDFEPEVFGVGWEGEAIRSVDGQNSNNSVRVPDRFLALIDEEPDRFLALIDEEPDDYGNWALVARTTGLPAKMVNAKDLWRRICRAAWACADPGVIFHDTVNAWHTTAADGPITTTNPCFTGDTLVWTIDGARSFNDLARDGKSVLVLTELEDGQLAYRPMVNPRRTQRDASLVEVTFRAQTGPRRTNEYTSIRCTPSHEFYLSDGQRVRADALRANDRIESAYRSKLNAKGYIGLFATNGDAPREHWLIAEIEYGRRPNYPEEHGHHRDENKANNSLGNVEIIKASDHNSEHMRGDRNPMRRWFRRLSDEERRVHLKKMSEAASGERNGNYGNDKIRGRIWINNGRRNRRIHPHEDIPEGWSYGYRRKNHAVVGVRYLPEVEDVYCGSVPSTGRFFVSVRSDRLEGILVSNCAEFHSNTDNACNLASLRLTAFLRPDGTIDLPLYEHACRLWTVVLDVSNSMAGFPTREFAVGARGYRTLGLGYADLGGLLMRTAIPYASDEGRSLAAGLTALMTGVAYRTSAEIAQELGPFPRWEANAEHMRRVLRNHACAAWGCCEVKGDGGRYEGLNVQPYVARGGDSDLWSAVDSVWAEIPSFASFRNAQVTLLAPTGTISFVLDCDTTGVEPDFALVKRKALAGGGSMSIVNQAVPVALRRLGYDETEVAIIQGQVVAHGHPITEFSKQSIVNCHLRPEHAAVFACANDLAPEAHVGMVAAVQPFLSGGVSKTINIPRGATVNDVDLVYRLAQQLGLKSVSVYRDGSKLTQPLASGVDRAVANSPPACPDVNQEPPDHDEGTLARYAAGDYRRDAPSADVKMAKFGADLSSRQQPLGPGHSEVLAKVLADNLEGIYVKSDDDRASDMLTEAADFIAATLAKPDPRAWRQLLAYAKEQGGLKRGEREYLPWRRERGSTWRQKVKIGDHGQTVFVDVSEYADGRPGEVFLEISHEGSTLRALADCLAIAISIGLQYGVPVEKYVDKLVGTRFEPAGYAKGHGRIRFASSIADYIGRELGITYAGRDDLANAPASVEESVERIAEASARLEATDPGWLASAGRVAAYHASGTPSGDPCPTCGELLRRTGTCRSCANCGYNEGCAG